MSQSLDQQRALHAWNLVQQAMAEQHPEKFVGQAKKLPIRIMTAGLGQALAFLEAKHYAPCLISGIFDWIVNGRRIQTAQPAPSLKEAIMRNDSIFLRQVTDEVLAYMQWVNRFAEAEGPPEEI